MKLKKTLLVLVAVWGVVMAAVLIYSAGLSEIVATPQNSQVIPGDASQMDDLGLEQNLAKPTGNIDDAANAILEDVADEQMVVSKEDNDAKNSIPDNNNDLNKIYE